MLWIVVIGDDDWLEEDSHSEHALRRMDGVIDIVIYWYIDIAFNVMLGIFRGMALAVLLAVVSVLSFDTDVGFHTLVGLQDLFSLFQNWVGVYSIEFINHWK